MSEIAIEHLSKSFGALKVLDNLNLKVKSGEFITFFGPNGCGKTTLLNILSGMESPTKGSILINGKPPAHSKIGFVFQDYNQSLFPWRTVSGNVEFALEAQNMDSGREAIAENVLKKIHFKEINLLAFRDKYPYELSGGMKQLTAIARALSLDPEFFLLAEPFSALDYTTTLKMEDALLDILGKTEKKETTLFVSHDLDEAIYLADRVVVLSKRPAGIAKIINVDLPRPRKMEMRLGKKFFALRNSVLKAFESGRK